MILVSRGVVLVEVTELVVHVDGPGHVLFDVERDDACLVLPICGDFALVPICSVAIVLVPVCDGTIILTISSRNQQFCYRTYLKLRRA